MRRYINPYRSHRGRPLLIPPTVLRELLQRNAEALQKSQEESAKRVHSACIGRETIESNLPL